LLLSVIHRLRAGRTRIMGGNFSAWRDDLFAVNGFNEGFATWGAEDDELHYRLCNLGRRARLVINR
ncbi:MAG: glycosyl transferase family 2, partial [Xanthomonadales bacterium]|nr:glycosyl transferase family 2 [Xanthomonadales bacterium]